MTRRRIKAKANAMEDADVNYISLVSRPASRIPFRLTKSDDDPTRKDYMIHLSKMFKRDGDAPKGCTLVGVVLQRKHEEYLTPKLAELGLKIDDRTENDDVVILRQADFVEGDDSVTAIKLGEVGGLFTGVPENVLKAFDPYSESDDFDENMALGFLPGMSAATEALFDTVVQVLRTSATADDAKSKIETNIDKYKMAVMDMAQGLPDMAFKLEKLDLEDFVEKNEPEADAPAEDAVAAESEAAEVAEEAAAEAAPEEAPAEAEAEAEAAPEAEAPAEEAAESVEKSDGLITAEEQQKLKGVHIEDLDVQAESTESSESTPKDELASVLQAMKSEVLEAISSVKSEVDELKSKQADLAETVNATAAIADRAQKAVKGTVRSGSDAGDRIRDESLGTRSRHKGGNADEAAWGGTALDRIVGDFGTNE
jgi:hypothetical protein